MGKIVSDWFDLSWLSGGEGYSFSLPSDPTIDELRALAQYKVTDNQARKITKRVKGLLKADPENTDGLKPVKLAILTDCNLEFCEQMLFATGLRYGLNVSTKIIEYSDILAQTTNPDSDLYAFGPNFVLYANFAALLNSVVLKFDENAGQEATQMLASEIKMATDAITSNSDAQIFVQTIPDTHPDLFANNDRFQDGAIGREIDALNQTLAGMGYSMVDTARLASRVGTYNWYSDSKYHWTKVPFNPSWNGVYCDQVIRKIAAAQGKGRKCLVLDLDNTLWGGVIGDDGLSGIKLGQNSPAGEAFLAGQRYYKMLANRGVVLAVCSKNDMSNGLLPFREHPDMILKESDIACFVANWQDKPGNLRHISDSLNLGLDSFVFLDDNPAERGFVRRELPMVAVPEVPNHDSSLYPRILEAAGYFESTGFTQADLKRAADYRANSERKKVESSTTDVGAYLKALDMQFQFEPFNEINEDRIVQLINRSNQFNLTTKRTTTAELASLQANDTSFGYTVRLSDKFSDSGLVVVIICKATKPDIWVIDTWLMSCRVLGRRAEEGTLAQIVEHANSQGVKIIRGHFIPTAKNGMVKEHYKKLGFKEIDAPETSPTSIEGETWWELDISDYNEALTALPFAFV